MRDLKTIPVDKFIEEALYNKKTGYYFSKDPFGKDGDFITSPGISFLFSEMIAIWIIYFWEMIGKPKNFSFVELGPGDGRLCKTLLNTFEKFPQFKNSTKIYLYEKSEKLIKIQKKNLKGQKISWIKNFKTLKNCPAIFFGNEFFDAIPIKQFKKKNNEIYEKYFKFKEKKFLETVYKKVSSSMLQELGKYGILKFDGIFEYPKSGLKELALVSKKIKSVGGGLLLVDYGFLGQNNVSTLQSVKKHKKNMIFDNIGKADITYLVNFDLLKNFLKIQNLNVNNVVSQSFFLKRVGIIKRAGILSNKMSFKEKSDLYYRLQRLLDPKQMGQLFKVICAYKSKKKISLGFK